MPYEALKPQESFTTEKALTHIPEMYKRDTALFDEGSGTLNIGSQETEAAAALLSNFAATPFELDGQKYKSVEGFIQALKFPDVEGTGKQQRVSSLEGYKAKRAGNKVKARIYAAYETNPPEKEPVGYVTNYQGIQIPYRSSEHYMLIERAIRAKVDQNPDVLQALIGINNDDRREITHILQRDDGSVIEESPITALPAEVFTTILMRIRKEKQEEFKQEKNT